MNSLKDYRFSYSQFDDDSQLSSEDRALLLKAKEAAESRFQGGIHFRTDNEVALELGKKVAEKIIKKVKTDGADNP